MGLVDEYFSSWAKARKLPWLFLTYLSPLPPVSLLSAAAEKNQSISVFVTSPHFSPRTNLFFFALRTDTLKTVGGMTGLSSNAEPGVLATARYGKDKVRVFRVVRDTESKVHNVVEYNVTVLLEGAMDTRYGRKLPKCRFDSRANLPIAKLHPSEQRRRRRDGLECVVSPFCNKTKKKNLSVTHQQ